MRILFCGIFLFLLYSRPSLCQECNLTESCERYLTKWIYQCKNNNSTEDFHSFINSTMADDKYCGSNMFCNAACIRNYSYDRININQTVKGLVCDDNYCSIVHNSFSDFLKTEETIIISGIVAISSLLIVGLSYLFYKSIYFQNCKETCSRIFNNTIRPRMNKSLRSKSLQLLTESECTENTTEIEFHEMDTKNPSNISSNIQNFKETCSRIFNNNIHPCMNKSLRSESLQLLTESECTENTTEIEFHEMDTKNPSNISSNIQNFKETCSRIFNNNIRPCINKSLRSESLLLLAESECTENTTDIEFHEMDTKNPDNL